MATGLKPRIHIIGGPGSGKSHTAAKLAKQFGVPACDLDDLFWNRAAPGYGVRAEVEQRNTQLTALVAQDGWIMEGVYYEWLVPSFVKADIIIALIPSIWIRHWRVVRRFVLRRLGKIPSKHESLGDFWRLLVWSHTYDSRNLTRAKTLIAAHGKTMAECKNFSEVVAAANNLRTNPC